MRRVTKSDTWSTFALKTRSDSCQHLQRERGRFCPSERVLKAAQKGALTDCAWEEIMNHPPQDNSGQKKDVESKKFGKSYKFNATYLPSARLKAKINHFEVQQGVSLAFTHGDFDLRCSPTS